MSHEGFDYDAFTSEGTRTYISATAAITIESAPPVVGPPTHADACKNDGCKTFNNPVFKNQCECVSYVRASPRASK